MRRIFTKLTHGALPHHSFHVLNIYKRTGHFDIVHVIETMDACLINWGKIKKIIPTAIIIETCPLKRISDKFGYGKAILRTIMPQGENDVLFHSLQPNDWISYHWGYFCQKLNQRQLRNLIYYTNLSVDLANKT